LLGNIISYRFLAPEHDSVEILPKIQDGGDITNFKNSKIEIFQKTLPRFVVPSSTKISVFSIQSFAMSLYFDQRNADKNQKTERKNVQNALSYGRNTSFQIKKRSMT
jgi:hypothetical protein